MSRSTDTIRGWWWKLACRCKQRSPAWAAVVAVQARLAVSTHIVQDEHRVREDEILQVWVENWRHVVQKVVPNHIIVNGSLVEPHRLHNIPALAEQRVDCDKGSPLSRWSSNPAIYIGRRVRPGGVSLLR